jgi:hypothetical protein
MASKAAKREMFVAERARALAVMYLTRRSDLVVEEVRADIGLDLIVRLVPADKEGLRQFGVELRGVWSSVTKEHADKVLRGPVREAQRYGPFAFPVCLFFFTMEEDQGWYTWVAEPVLESGKAHLRMCMDANCKPLGKAALNEIVAQVDRWYDTFFENLVTDSTNGCK